MVREVQKDPGGKIHRRATEREFTERERERERESEREIHIE